MRNYRNLICALIGAFVIGAITTTICAAAEKIDLTATASSIYSTYYSADKALDGNLSTYWIGARNRVPWWFMLDAGKILNLKQIKINWYGYYYYAATDFDIQISEDGQTWEDVYTGLSSQGNEKKTYELSKRARYLRIYINSIFIPSYFPVIPEIEVYAEKSAEKFIPRKIRFQSALKDNSETYICRTFRLTFGIYDAESGGAPLWSETHQNVEIENGKLDVILGSLTEIDLPFDRQYYLGVEVENDGEMTPRFMMTSAPYAFISEK